MVLEYIGWNVRRLRLARGVGQAALAEAVGIKLHTLRWIEAARVPPTITVMVLLAGVLEVTPRALLSPASRPVIKRGRPPKISTPVPRSQVE